MPGTVKKAGEGPPQVPEMFCWRRNSRAGYTGYFGSSAPVVCRCVCAGLCIIFILRPLKLQYLTKLAVFSQCRLQMWTWVTRRPPWTPSGDGAFMRERSAFHRVFTRPLLFHRRPVNKSILFFHFSLPCYPPHRRGSKLSSPCMMTRSHSSCSRASVEWGSTSASLRLQRELG